MKNGKITDGFRRPLQYRPENKNSQAIWTLLVAVSVTVAAFVQILWPRKSFVEQQDIGSKAAWIRPETATATHEIPPRAPDTLKSDESPANRRTAADHARVEWWFE